MAGQLLLINPRRRRRAKKSARRAKRSRRAMTPLQLKYFGGGRKRRAARLHANPKRRSRRSAPRKSARRSARRSVRQFGTRIGFSLPAIQSSMKTALIGAGGAVAVDALMGQANRVLPADWQSRHDAAGSLNWKYYLAKGALAIGLGVAGARYGGRYRGAVLTMAQGSLMVQAYEILREYVPQDFLPLGFYSNGPVQNLSAGGTPGRVVSMGKYLPRNTLAGMGNRARVGASSTRGRIGG